MGIELRRLRDAVRMTAAEAGAYVGMSGAHLGHVESGRTPIPEDKLRTLLATYGCESKTFTEALVAWSEAPRGWWYQHKRDTTAYARDLAEMESMATHLSEFQPVHLPGLLQTPEYVKALIQATYPDSSTAFTERGLEFRLKRQELLTRHSAPTYHAIIHEAAFQMHFVDTAIMRRQIVHIIEVARLPHITLQIVPFRSGTLPAVGTPFAIFCGSDPALSTIYLEHDVGSVFLHDHEHITRYGEIFNRLATLALPPVIPESERVSYSTRDSFSLLQHLLYVL
ncbi:helix-turn-helix domain-containing protein [Streptomyces gobiensis]|uniref:helix-turn-helix domain-containing protein n=1 Tax=Streptomyces gobiensis TaxID=2875706 RepID=UPI001E2CD501|nr:helix-turn-helix transcriptional regulator [Streptomyces gobiensis]